MTETPTPTRPRPGDSDYVINRRPPTEDELRIVAASGGRLNPDTNGPLSQPRRGPQADLVAELLDRLDASGLDYPVALVQNLLGEAIVRQHGRTLRGCIAEVADAAREQETEARRRLTMLGDDGPSDEWVLPAAEHSAAARVLRRVQLRGDRS